MVSVFNVREENSITIIDETTEAEGSDKFFKNLEDKFS